MNYPWFRLYSDVLHDKKITRTSVQVKQPKAVVLGLWVTILSLANDSPERGKLLISDGIPLTIDEILYEAGLNGEGLPIIEEFVKANMLSIEGETVIVIHWEDRQFASDHSRERVKQYRERKKAVTETVKKRYSNVTVTAQESESEKEILSKDNSEKISQRRKSKENSGTVGPKTIVRDKFFELTQLSEPPKKTMGTWWGWFSEILTIGQGDPIKACHIMETVIVYMRNEHLTITSPKSLINLARSVASGQELVRKNGNRQEPARASPKAATLTPEQQAAYEKLSRE
jgi:hypothetical protein